MMRQIQEHLPNSHYIKEFCRRTIEGSLQSFLDVEVHPYKKSDRNLGDMLRENQIPVDRMSNGWGVFATETYEARDSSFGWYKVRLKETESTLKMKVWTRKPTSGEHDVSKLYEVLTEYVGNSIIGDLK